MVSPLSVYITPKEAAKRAQVSISTLRNWLNDSKTYPGLGIKVGGRWRVFPAPLQSLITTGVLGVKK